MLKVKLNAVMPIILGICASFVEFSFLKVINVKPKLKRAVRKIRIM